MSDIAITAQFRNKIAWLVGTALAFLIFVIIGSYSARMTRDYTDYNQKRTKDRYALLAKTRDEANKTLTSTDWVDQGKQIVRIPIDEAMAKEVETLKTKPAAIGNEIPGSAPAPAKPAAAPAPAPAAAPANNAAPAKPSAPPATNAAPTAPAPPAKPQTSTRSAYGSRAAIVDNGHVFFLVDPTDPSAEGTFQKVEGKMAFVLKNGQVLPFAVPADFDIANGFQLATNDGKVGVVQTVEGLQVLRLEDGHLLFFAKGNGITLPKTVRAESIRSENGHIFLFAAASSSTNTMPSVTPEKK